MLQTRLRNALAGMQAGTAGVLLMLGWLMLASLFNRRSAWLPANLYATTFYGPEAYRNAFTSATASGIAFLLAAYAGLGALWGAIWGQRRPRFFSLFGALAGLAVYWIFRSAIWQHLNPLMTIYAPERQLQVAHLLWGMMLARSPRYAGKLKVAADSSA